MRVIHFDYPGPPDVLKISERIIPSPLDDEILIKVIASGVNRPDLLQREGNYPAPPGHSDLLGLEASGVIEKMGKNVELSLIHI